MKKADNGFCVFLNFVCKCRKPLLCTPLTERLLKCVCARDASLLIHSCFPCVSSSRLAAFLHHVSINSLMASNLQWRILERRSACTASFLSLWHITRLAPGCTRHKHFSQLTLTLTGNDWWFPLAGNKVQATSISEFPSHYILELSCAKRGRVLQRHIKRSSSPIVFMDVFTRVSGCCFLLGFTTFSYLFS